MFMFDVIEIVSYSSAYVDFLVFFWGGLVGRRSLFSLWIPMEIAKRFHQINSIIDNEMII